MSTIEKVQQIWKDKEGEEIARCIDLLESRPIEAITCLVTNQTLRKRVKKYKIPISEAIKK
jgi:hypothetical protein